MVHPTEENIEEYDFIIKKIAEYVSDRNTEFSQISYDTAHYALLDSMGCALLALRYPEANKHLGPIIPGTIVPHHSSVNVPGTQYELDPVRGAWNITTLIRWLDYNDTFLAKEFGHPSDNFGAILSAAQYYNKQIDGKRDGKKYNVKDVLHFAIKAYEIQGQLSIDNSLNRLGIDHVFFVKLASTAVVTMMLGGNKEQVEAAISNAIVDNGPLRTYRHFPNTGERKSWAAADAASRAVNFAMMHSKGERGYPSVVTTKTWGYQDVVLKGQTFAIERPLGSYIMENVLFKISYPAEFHGQTAVEMAIQIHHYLKENNKNISDVDKLTINTHEAAIRIIDKKGPLTNYADRDHCMQYMVAVGLLFGRLVADDYSDHFAKTNPQIDELRERIVMVESKTYSTDYLDPEKRSQASDLQVQFKDGSVSPVFKSEFPIGHRLRRKEGIPLLVEKFQKNVETRFPSAQRKSILNLCLNKEELFNTEINEFMKLWVI
eukprot:TRINITY_DN4979_c0_g1_i1.p1 TRINITY_DN4979_c0_g1~~TRINITY_DN4979_c0_g1_i1.p1  ORF type:complete len:489 (-),score=107.56 TRINITY_DN4979_c0_g1_i1:12-1478(-)